MYKFKINTLNTFYFERPSYLWRKKQQNHCYFWYKYLNPKTILQCCVVWESVLWEQSHGGDTWDTMTTFTHLDNAI